LTGIQHAQTRQLQRQIVEAGKALGICVEFMKHDLARLRSTGSALASVGARLKEHPGVTSLFASIAKDLPDFAAEVEQRFKEGGAQ